MEFRKAILALLVEELGDHVAVIFGKRWTTRLSLPSNFAEGVRQQRRNSFESFQLGGALMSQRNWNQSPFLADVKWQGIMDLQKEALPKSDFCVWRR